MFNLKKVALVGVAGLAAFSMSCSDSDGTDAGGTFTTPLGATFAEGVISLSGVITATQPSGIDAIAAGANAVKSVKVTANDLESVITGLNGIVLPAPTADLDGVFSGIQTICGTATGEKSVKIEVTASFNDGADLSESKSVTINCGGPVTDPDLVKTPITLSSAGTSYADLDSNKTYKQAEAATRKAEIDIVAYNGQVGESEIEDAIYNPSELDFFYSEDFTTYLGGTVSFYKLPTSPINAVVLLNSATKLSQISSFLTEENLESIQADENEIDDYVPATKDTGFLVVSTKGKLFAVIITNTGAKKVDLSSIAFPE